MTPYEIGKALGMGKSAGPLDWLSENVKPHLPRITTFAEQPKSPAGIGALGGGAAGVGIGRYGGPDTLPKKEWIVMKRPPGVAPILSSGGPAAPVPPKPAPTPAPVAMPTTPAPAKLPLAIAGRRT